MKHFPVSYGAAYAGEAPVLQIGAGWIFNTFRNLKNQRSTINSKPAERLKVVTARISANSGNPNDRNRFDQERHIVRRLMQTQLNVLKCPSDTTESEFVTINRNG